MANNFRNISYARMTYEALRNYYAVNAAGEVSILYKFLACCIQPLQSPFDAYQLFRTKEALIASCQWQIGQLTNVLNFLYDTALSRIFITQSELQFIVDPMFQYPPIHWDSDFATAPPEIFEREFGDTINQTIVTINIPSSANESDLIATVNQIRLQGIPYVIAIF